MYKRQGLQAPTGITTKDLGFVGHIHDGSSASKVAFAYDMSASKFVALTGVTEGSGAVTGTAATIVADLEGDVTGNVTGDLTGDVTGDLTGTASAATLAAKATALNTTSNGIVKTTSGNGTISIGSLSSGDIPNNAADTSGNAATATLASTVTVTDNESTSENNLIAFVADAGSSTGAHGLEMDGTLTYLSLIHI